MHIKDALKLADALPRKTLPEYTEQEAALLALAGAYRRRAALKSRRARRKASRTPEQIAWDRLPTFSGR